MLGYPKPKGGEGATAQCTNKRGIPMEQVQDQTIGPINGPARRVRCLNAEELIGAGFQICTCHRTGKPCLRAKELKRLPGDQTVLLRCAKGGGRDLTPLGAARCPDMMLLAA